jgi:glycosyltransferase involved in cell wall biosynthesis
MERITVGAGNHPTNGLGSGSTNGIHQIALAQRERKARPSVAPLEAPTTSVILPAYNEAEALPKVLDALFAVLATMEGRHEVIVVDDGSTDATAAIAVRYPCRLLRHPENRGKGAAVRTGIAEAEGRYVVIIDADDTYPSDALPRLVELLEEHDFVRGVRSEGKGNIPFVNRLGNIFFDNLLQTLHGLEGKDHLTGLYGLRRDALMGLGLTASGFELEAEITIKAHAFRLRTTSFPIRYGARLGQKKLHPWRDGWRILRHSFDLALLYNPGRAFVAPGVLLWALAAFVAFVLSQRTPELTYLGLGAHAFAVATFGALVGFQCVLFGMAAALYAAQTGVPPHPWLVTVSSAQARLILAVVGTAIALAGLGGVGAGVADWLGVGAVTSAAAQRLVVAAVAVLCGLQMVFVALFISVFAGSLRGVGREGWSPAR